MKITFVIPFASLAGGIRVVATYARVLSERGHDVTVISQPYGQNVSLRAKLKQFLGLALRVPPPERTTLLDFLGPKHIVLDTERAVEASDTPDADAVVATWWETAEWVASLPKEKGAGFYLLQDYEVYPPQPEERVAATFKLPLNKIAVSAYIRDTITKKHGVPPFPVVLNAVDHTQFFAPDRAKNKNLTVGLLYTPVQRKRVALAFEAMEQARKAVPDLKALIFGAGPPSDHLMPPSWAQYVCAPDQDEIATLYASCDVWLLASEKEGFGLPLLEAMACRTPVISTFAGAAPDLIDGSNGKLVDGNSEAIAGAIMEFALMDNSEWQDFSKAAYQTAQLCNWDRSASELISIIENGTKSP